jgi:hypothetical protein
VGFVSPEMFGAKGDGETDDTLAVQVAINYAIQYNSDNEHNHVAFKGKPDSRYLISSGIDIILPNSTYLYGDFDFQGAELIVKSDSELQYVIKYHNPSANHNDVHSKGGIRNLTINGNLESAHTGLYITCCSAATFERINIYDCRRGIYLTNKDSGETIIRDCTSRRNITLDLYNQLDSGNLKLAGVFAESGRGEELNTEDKINLVKTQCVGFEITCDDAFIENCVAIDHVIGIKLASGDNKVSGCHPWNMALNQLHSSCCFFTNGNNYFVNNTCDRFYIGVYCYLNVQNLFVNTLFTNRARGSNDNSNAPNYCWYLGTYAANTKGQVINAVNTKVNGNDQLAERNLYWCNINDYRINDSGTVGYHLLGYRPSKIEDGYLAKIESVAGTIPIDTDCVYTAEDFDGSAPKDTSAGNTFGIFHANGCTFRSVREVYNQGAEDEYTLVRHRIIAASSGASSVRFLIQNAHFITGRQYLICFKYKSKRANTTVNITSSVSNEKPFKFRNEDDLKAVEDYTNYFNVFTAVTGSIIGIGFKTKKVGDEYVTMYNDDGLNQDYLEIADIRLFDVTGIPRYFLESGSAYAKRLFNFCKTHESDVAIPADPTVSFKALKLPVNMDKSSNTSDVDYDYYDIGYDNCGRAKFNANKTYVEGENNYNNYAELKIDAQTLAIDLMMVNAEAAPFAAVWGNPPIKNNFECNSNKTADHTRGRVYTTEQMPVKLYFYPHDNDDDFTLTSFRLGKTLGCDEPVVDSGGLSPVYNRGEVYVVKKGCKPWEPKHSPLPTVLYQITMVEDSTISADGGVTDYDELTSKPQINGVTLSGNKSGDDLGLQEKLTIQNSSGYDPKDYLSLYNDRYLVFNSQYVLSIQSSGFPKLSYWSSDNGVASITANSIISDELTVGVNGDIPVSEGGTYYRFCTNTETRKEIYLTSSGKAYQKLTTLPGGTWIEGQWQEIGGGSQIVSGVVNENGTITFTDSDGNTFTTTGASVIGPQGDPGQDYVLTEQDKSDIANIVLGELPTTEGVLYGN